MEFKKFIAKKIKDTSLIRSGWQNRVANKTLYTRKQVNIAQSYSIGIAHM